MAYYTQKEFEHDKFFDNPKIKGKDLLGKRADAHLGEVRTFLSNAEKSIQDKDERTFTTKRRNYMWHYCRVFYTMRPKNIDYVIDMLIRLIEDTEEPEMAGFTAAILRACLKRAVRDKAKEECKRGFFFFSKTVQEMFFSDDTIERKKAAYIGRYVDMCTENHALCDNAPTIFPCRTYTLKEHSRIYKSFIKGISIDKYTAYNADSEPSISRMDYTALMNAATFARELVTAKVFENDDIEHLLIRYASLFERFEKNPPYKIEDVSYYKERIKSYSLLKEACTPIAIEGYQLLPSKTLPFYIGCELDDEKIKELALHLKDKTDKDTTDRIRNLCDRRIVNLKIWDKIRYPLKMLLIMLLAVNIPALFGMNIKGFLFDLYSFAFSNLLIGIPFIIIPSLITLYYAYEAVSHKEPKAGYYSAGISGSHSHTSNQDASLDRCTHDSQDIFDKWYYARIPECQDINFDIDGFIQNKWTSERLKDI